MTADSLTKAIWPALAVLAISGAVAATIKNSGEVKVINARLADIQRRLVRVETKLDALPQKHTAIREHPPELARMTPEVK